MFVSYANKWYKLMSVWVFVLIGLLTMIQPNLADLGLPSTWQGYITTALSVLGILARLVGQPSVTSAAEQE